MSGSSTSTISRPRRNSAWSSAISTRIGSERKPGLGPSAGTVARSPSALTSLPPSGFGTNVTLRLWLTRSHDASPGRHRPGPAIVQLLLDQPDYTVVVAATAIDHAEPVAFAVVEKVKVMPDKLHLQQCLVDGHRLGRVFLLPDHERSLAFHLDGHQMIVGVCSAHCASRFGVRPSGREILDVTGVEITMAAVIRVGRGCHQNPWRPDACVVTVLDLATVARPAEPGFQLRQGHVERGVLVISRRFGPDRGSAGQDRQLDAFASIGLPCIGFLGDLYVDPHRSGVELASLASLAVAC